jgi:hypothetical protein
VDERALEEAVARLRSDERAWRAHALLAPLFGGLAIVGAFQAPSYVAAVLGVAAVIEVLVAGGIYSRRRAALEALALQTSAYRVPEVRVYAEALVSPGGRERLARRVERLPELVMQRETVFLRARVLGYEEQLLALAGDLRSSDHEVDPVSAVECLRLLEDAPASPLCNPDLGEDDLAAALYRIRAGIRPT